MALGYLTPFDRRSGLARGGPGGGSLFDLHHRMNRLFDDLFDRDGDTGFFGRSGMAAPAMDIHQDDDKVEIAAELPGVKEEDIDLTVEDGVLTLRGEKRSTREDADGGYRERSYGSFERRIALPSGIDEEACSADFSDGVLTITLPRTAEKSRGRKIPLGSGGARQIEQDGGKKKG
ncbi:Hsp20/alpha crystallin family protein [Pelagerythrobacter marensis]|uniref:Hsp20/alpha crystallin family protein n=1 Tax=Pelagerythrobacter marensis TaxID=543877 RepID=A0ABZ2D084_9SPHN